MDKSQERLRDIYTQNNPMGAHFETLPQKGINTPGDEA